MSLSETVAFPDPTQAEGAAGRMTKAGRERYLELWDAGDQYDEELAAAWDVLDNPTRPRDRDLLPDAE